MRASLSSTSNPTLRTAGGTLAASCFTVAGSTQRGERP
jgi:hypothetical protein